MLTLPKTSAVFGARLGNGSRTAKVDCGLSLLESVVNLPVGPNVDASRIAYSRLKTETGSHAAVGPFVPSVSASVNTLTSSSPARRMVTMAALR